MSTAKKSAVVHWQGDLNGTGTVTAGSRVFVDQPVSWPARTEPDNADKTSPEELLAAAHASCFAMALSGALKKKGFVPKELAISAIVSFGQRDGNWSILSVELDVEGNVPGIDEGTFARIAAQAKVDCPVSRALAGNVSISVEVSLASEQMAAAAGP